MDITKFLNIFLVFSLFSACGQNKKSKRSPEIPDLIHPGIFQLRGDWYNLDAKQGGINVDLAYAEGVFSNEVIVAVIDSGISLAHEDLRDRLWVNSQEIPNNNIDDDRNGYVDDIHGWNYLVDKDGSKIHKETLEVTRELRRLLDLQNQRQLTEAEADYFSEVKAGYDRVNDIRNPKNILTDINSQQRGDDLDDFTLIDASNPAYGNNDIDDTLDHGTHVSGIIAANRSNQIGIMGVADLARIMTLRVVPQGDEQDKDIYHAVRYAVDHGARIINMSFGKSFSRHPEKVKEAFQYAHDHNVLLVHAAGNSGLNIDDVLSFPSRYVNGNSQLNESWLEVGAVNLGPKFEKTAFSNYGRHSVDIFAPGANIMSTISNNSYMGFSGTSMASPVVAGVAALILSAYPEIKATELRSLLIETVQTVDGASNSLNLQEHSIAGGVVDALAILQKAKERSRQP